MPDNTPNLNLSRPEFGTTRWDLSLNDNFTIIDQVVSDNTTSIVQLSGVSYDLDVQSVAASADNQTVFNYVNSLPQQNNQVLVFIDGISTSDFAVTGTTQLTLEIGVNSGTTVKVTNIAKTEGSSNEVSDIVSKYTETIGDGNTNPITITHGLGTRSLTYSIMDTTTYDLVDADISLPSVDTMKLTFTTPPISGGYDITIIGYVKDISKYTETIGDGVTNPITINHGLGTKAITYSIMDTNTYDLVDADIKIPTINTIELTFTTTPIVGGYDITILG